MNISSAITTSALMLAATVLSGCLGPNPLLLKECDTKWIVVAQGAQGETLRGDLHDIESDGQWVSETTCYNDAQSANALDPASAEYQALQNAALAACQVKAVQLGLVNDTCAESLTPPVSIGPCTLAEAECLPSGETGETGETGEPGETGETGDDGGFIYPAGLVICEGDACAVKQDLIDQVLQAGPSAFEADGTTLAPHLSATGAQDGWEFGGISTGNLGAALGFENGDVVTEVAGEPVDSWSAVVDAANAALHAEYVDVVFIRDNEVLTRRYSRM